MQDPQTWWDLPQENYMYIYMYIDIYMYDSLEN